MIYVWVLFSILLFAILWMYVGYPFTLWLLNKVLKNAPHREEYLPQVSVIVCTYNESVTIERRIQNLVESDYPREKLEIIIVDSNSADKTADLVETIIPKYPDNDIKLIQEDERKGKVSAINLGLKEVKGEIVFLTDSPTIFWKDTIKFIVQNFADPRVGAATGDFVRKITDGTTNAQETEWMVFNYRKFLRRMESLVDSTTWLSGELTSFRKSLIPQIPSSVIIDDAHIAMSIREKGYRVVVDERAKYTEKRPTIFNETVTNKIKTIAPGIREAVRFKKMILNPKFKYYGLLIFPARMMYFYLNPFLFMGLILCSLILLIYYFEPFILLVGAMFLAGAAMVASLYKKGTLLRPFIAFFLMQYIILAGLLQYVRGSYSRNWKQVTTTRS